MKLVFEDDNGKKIGCVDISGSDVKIGKYSVAGGDIKPDDMEKAGDKDGKASAVFGLKKPDDDSAPQARTPMKQKKPGLF